MSQRRTIEIKDKIATYLSKEPIVCGNSDYVIDFIFDEEWNEHTIKTARFKIGGQYIDVVFDGNVCEVPIISNAKIAWVGVFAGNLSTTTPAIIPCAPCILDGEDVPAPPKEDVYSQIMAMINEYIELGAMTRDELIVLIDEQTADLQEASSEELATIAKTIVGAINETNEIANSGKTTAETAVENARKAQETADSANRSANEAVVVAQTANATAETSKEIAERAEKTVDLIDDIASQALNVSAQALSIASRLDITAIESKVEKTDEPDQLYGTDENGKPKLYHKDSVGTKVFVDGQKVVEFNADEKFDKTGGVVGGEVTIEGDLIVKGTTKTVDTETLSVKDNIIVANVDNAPLASVSGFAVKTGEVDEKTQKQLAYGIMYDKLGDGVKIGLGGFDENGDFVYNVGQAQFLATRADNITDGHIPQWDNVKKQFVDSGKETDDFVGKNDYAKGYFTTTKPENWGYGVVKPIIGGQGGIDVPSTHAGGLRNLKATYDLIDARTPSNYLDGGTVGNNHCRPITPAVLDYATMSSLADCKDTTLWTDTNKAKACETIGAVTKTNFENNKGTKLYLHRISHSGGDDILIVNRYSMEYTSTEEIVANVFEGSSEEHLPINSYYMNGAERVKILQITRGVPSSIWWLDVNSQNFATADFGDLSSDTVTEL